MLPTTVQLHDIDDVEGFVCATIERSGIQPSEHEKEELVADGICILYGLAATFEPHRPGYAQAGRFSGFAAQFLPRRLGDAWHSRHPEHVRVVGEDGKRRWVYRDTPISLDQFLTAGSSSVSGAGRAGAETHIRPTAHQAPVPLPA
ncbi:MAG TPA: hypothetical protein VGC63_05020 [Solirubrobacterales bacterium]